MSSSEPSLKLSHVVDRPRRYPGEPVVFFSRVAATRDCAGFALRIEAPAGLEILETRAGESHGTGSSDLLMLEGKRYVSWRLDRPIAAGERFEYELSSRIEPVARDLTLASRALAMVAGSGDKPDWDEDSATVTVAAQARSLKYLPALYTEQDEMMGRFLMVFESFWSPVEGTIESMHQVLDPMMAPAELLPWLAQCVDLTISGQWNEAQKRRLIDSALVLYRQRGTRRGLQRFLELYTGQTPQIVEHRANNLRLGPDARLATSIAMGQRNIPHTFTVTLALPPEQSTDAAERRRLEAGRRRTIEAIIDSEKPAHTAYTLIIQQNTTGA
jgi:phage tail-like protein